MENDDAVDVCIPSSDTIVEVSEGYVKEIPNRERMRRGQTPQGFRVKLLVDAWERFNQLSDPKPSLTCDCSLLKLMSPDISIKEVLGEEENIKITISADLDIAERILEVTRPRILGEDDDSGIVDQQSNDLVGAVCVIIGGGSGIGASIAKLISKSGGISIVTSRRFGTDASDGKSLAKELLSIYKKYRESITL